MNKKINVAGIELDNYNVRESMMQIQNHLDTPALYIVEEVTMNTILAAQKDQKVREALEQVMHTIIAEPGILEAVGEKNVHRRYEAEHHGFFYALMKQLESENRKIFLIGEEENEVERIYKLLLEEFPDCQVSDAAALGNYSGTMDKIVNEINALDVDVVVSILPSPKQEYFLLENKEMLSVRLWYGVDAGSLLKQHNKLGHFLRRHIYRRQLKEHISNYKKEDEGK